MAQRILIDNDALLKLACYGLLSEAVSFFECSPENAFVLATAKYSILPDRNRLRFCEDKASATRLEKFFQASSLINVQQADPNLLDTLNTVQNIDVGEAILFAIGSTDRDSIVITGDKRSLAALCSHDSVATVYKGLERRVVSMEILFLYLIENQFSYIQDRVRAKPSVDKALSIAFGVTEPTDLASVREGLNSYIQYLRSETGNLLYPT